ncbi:hypothetical protein BDN70DRAFT_939270 [Pholiota conissans]|uniref:Uncharacterized protein n=1 Tax=Pholiota conissans TaxID=109636 RepID=A0A9P6CLT0_9AGAR|nr:hypothetical protein BDN70DRAFT_939270 [Pholiota conissans]
MPALSNTASTLFTAAKTYLTSSLPPLIVYALLGTHLLPPASVILFLNIVTPSDTRNKPPTSSSLSLAISMLLGTHINPAVSSSLSFIDSTLPPPQKLSPTSFTYRLHAPVIVFHLSIIEIQSPQSLTLSPVTASSMYQPMPINIEGLVAVVRVAELMGKNSEFASIVHFGISPSNSHQKAIKAAITGIIDATLPQTLPHMT